MVFANIGRIPRHELSEFRDGEGEFERRRYQEATLEKHERSP
jgi:hypothetical protein